MAAVVRRRRWPLWLAAVVVVAVLMAGVVLVPRIRRSARGAVVDLGDEGDYVDASDYKRLTGIAKESYERRLLAEARALMMGEWTVRSEDAPASTRLGALERGWVDDVRLEGDGTDVALAVLFRSDARPDSVFGRRVPIWPAPAPDDPDEGTPEGCAFLLSVNLMELIVNRPGSTGGSDLTRRLSHARAEEVRPGDP
jgi:hypothetical protein